MQGKTKNKHRKKFKTKSVKKAGSRVSAKIKENLKKEGEESSLDTPPASVSSPVVSATIGTPPPKTPDPEEEPDTTKSPGERAALNDSPTDTTISGESQGGKRVLHI